MNELARFREKVVVLATRVSSGCDDSFPRYTGALRGYRCTVVRRLVEPIWRPPSFGLRSGDVEDVSTSNNRSAPGEGLRLSCASTWPAGNDSNTTLMVAKGGRSSNELSSWTVARQTQTISTFVRLRLEIHCLWFEQKRINANGLSP